MGSFSRRVCGAAGAVLAGIGLATVPSAAHATPTAVVPVKCNTPALIEAISAANAPNSQTLKLAQNCTYDLTGVAETGTRGPNGLPIIRGNITLIGKNTTIRRNVNTPFRIVEVAAGAGLFLRGITIAGGEAGSNTGGGILNDRGRVLLFHSLVFGNSADSGAGISNDSGSLRLVSSTVRNNTTNSGGGGGGIYNDGALLVRYSRVNSNRANTHGGGIFNGMGGRVYLYRSDVVGNIAVAYGGGVYNGNGGFVRGDLVRISFNGALGGGGHHSLAKPGSATYTRSAVVQNNPNNCAPVGTVPGCTE